MNPENGKTSSFQCCIRFLWRNDENWKGFPLLNDTVKLRMTTTWFLQNRKMKQTQNLNTNSMSQIYDLLTTTDIVLSVGVNYDVKYILWGQISSSKPAPPCKDYWQSTILPVNTSTWKGLHRRQNCHKRCETSLSVSILSSFLWQNTPLGFSTTYL